MSATVDLRTSDHIKARITRYAQERRALLDAGEWSRIQHADKIELLNLAVNSLIDELTRRGDLAAPTT